MYAIFRHSCLLTVVCYFSAQLYAIVPLSSLQCYPMGGPRTGPWSDPLATGWGTFDGEHNLRTVSITAGSVTGPAY
jgi:hypothetical protein